MGQEIWYYINIMYVFILTISQTSFIPFAIMLEKYKALFANFLLAHEYYSIFRIEGSNVLCCSVMQDVFEGIHIVQQVISTTGLHNARHLLTMEFEVRNILCYS